MIDRRSEVLVLLREVRDPRPPVRLEVGGAGVRENGLRRLVNPADLTALEVALRLAEHGGGAVTAVAIGDERLDDALRLALAVGAGRAVRVWDDAMRDGDAAADATVLQRVLEIVRPALLAATAAELERWGIPDLGLPARALGFDGAVLRPAGLAFPRTDPLRVATPDPTLSGPERVKALFSGGIRPRGGTMRFGDADEAVERLLQIFAEEGLAPRSRA